MSLPATAQQQLEDDVAALESQNSRLSELNERGRWRPHVPATGESLPAEPKPWRSWFVDKLGFRYEADDARRRPDRRRARADPGPGQGRSHDRGRVTVGYIAHHAAQLLRQGDARPHALRLQADRDDRGRRPGPHPGHPRRQAPGCTGRSSWPSYNPPSPTFQGQAGQRPRSSPAPRTASGSPGAAG